MTLEEENREILQKEAEELWYKNNCQGTLGISVGGGKTHISMKIRNIVAVLALESVLSQAVNPKSLSYCGLSSPQMVDPESAIPVIEDPAYTLIQVQIIQRHGAPLEVLLFL